MPFTPDRWLCFTRFLFLFVSYFILLFRFLSSFFFLFLSLPLCVFFLRLFVFFLLRFHLLSSFFSLFLFSCSFLSLFFLFYFLTSTVVVFFSCVLSLPFLSFLVISNWFLLNFHLIHPSPEFSSIFFLSHFLRIPRCPFLFHFFPKNFPPTLFLFSFFLFSFSIFSQDFPPLLLFPFSFFLFLLRHTGSNRDLSPADFLPTHFYSNNFFRPLSNGSLTDR